MHAKVYALHDLSAVKYVITYEERDYSLTIGAEEHCKETLAKRLYNAMLMCRELTECGWPAPAACEWVNQYLRVCAVMKGEH